MILQDKKFKKVTYPDVKPNMYAISECGDIYSFTLNRLLKPYEDKDGYLKIGLMTIDNKSKNIFIHRLVGWEFVKNPNNFPVIDHLDGNKKNNYWMNLEWVTVKINTNRAEDMGLRKVRGEDNGYNKYSEELVRNICEKLELGYGVFDIYTMITGNERISKNKDDKNLYHFIDKLRNRTVWNHVNIEYKYTKESTKRKSKKPTIKIEDALYSEELVRKICSMLQEGLSMANILKKIKGEDVTVRDEPGFYMLIQDIKSRKRWINISKDYNFDNVKREKIPYTEQDFYSYICDGLKPKEIIRILGFTPKENRRLYDKIVKANIKYKQISSINNEQYFTIYIT